MRRSMRSTVEYGSRPKYAKPGIFTPMSPPPGIEKSRNAVRDAQTENETGSPRRVAGDGVMLESDVQIAGLIVTGTGTGVLTEDLILRSRRKAGNERRRNSNADERMIAISPVLVELRGPKTGLFCDRIVSADRVQARVGSRQGSDINARSGAGGSVIHRLTCMGIRRARRTERPDPGSENRLSTQERQCRDRRDSVQRLRPNQ